jgi:DNA-binding CsgD family transcriptional regulator
VLDWLLNHGELVEAAGIVLGLYHFLRNWRFTPGNEARNQLEQIYRLSEKTELPPAMLARLYNVLGIAYHSEGKFAQAEIFHNKALQLWRELGDKANTAKALMDLGWYCQFQMKLVEAGRYADQSLQLAREIGDRRGVASALHLLAMALSFSNRLKETIPVGEESLAIWRELGDLQSIASCLGLLARSEIGLGNYRQAQSHLAEAFLLLVELQNNIGLGVLFVPLARLVLEVGKMPGSAKISANLMGITIKWYEELVSLGVRKPGMAAAVEEPLIKELKQILGEEIYAQEYVAGTKFTQEEAVNFALDLLKSQTAQESLASPTTTLPNGLTEREAEVLRLVAAGLSNPAIAEKLVLSRRTVEAHLRSIFNKLEVTSRSEAALFAVEHNLAR